MIGFTIMRIALYIKIFSHSWTALGSPCVKSQQVYNYFTKQEKVLDWVDI